MHQKLLWYGCAWLLCAACAPGRAGEPAIAVANLEQIFKEHQQLKQIIAQLNAQTAQQAAERKRMVDDLDTRQAELRQLNLDALKADLTETERAQRREQAEARLHDFRVIEARILRADEANRRQLATRLQELRQQYFTEIQAQVRAYAAEHHHALVLDSASLAAQTGAGGVLYAGAQIDITGAVIARVNQPRPAAATNAPAGPQK
jgi:Skp family chaperone for outer membrane proteins